LKEDKILIRQFKDKSSNFFVNNTHYNLNALGGITFCAGGISSEADIEALQNFIKRNKKTFVASTPNVFSKELKEYSVLNFGIHKNKRLDTLSNDYLKWLFENSADESIKNEVRGLIGK
jgi:UDP-N-acetylmuramoylalanine-D-glutamate ligase